MSDPFEKAVDDIQRAQQKRRDDIQRIVRHHDLFSVDIMDWFDTVVRQDANPKLASLGLRLKVTAPQKLQDTRTTTFSIRLSRTSGVVIGDQVPFPVLRVELVNAEIVTLSMSNANAAQLDSFPIGEPFPADRMKHLLAQYAVDAFCATE